MLLSLINFNFLNILLLHLYLGSVYCIYGNWDFMFRYHKIPGDICVDGFKPAEATIVDLAATCKDDTVGSSVEHGYDKIHQEEVWHDHLMPVYIHFHVNLVHCISSRDNHFHSLQFNCVSYFSASE